jgi:peptide deformylase
MKYRIRYIGDPVLRKKSEPVVEFNEELMEFIKEFSHIMYKEDGIGLAAPQIGISKQILAIDVSPVDDEGELEVFINPKILEFSGESTVEEGCLSIPNVREEVTRPEKIKLEYQDKDGNTYIREFEDWPARVLQHEIDHLNAVLFVDHISPLKRQLLINQKVIPEEY